MEAFAESIKAHNEPIYELLNRLGYETVLDALEAFAKERGV